MRLQEGDPSKTVPRIWMTSSTYDRPWRNLEGKVVAKVGLAVPKSSGGAWRFVAVLKQRLMWSTGSGWGPFLVFKADSCTRGRAGNC
jgi:hypothetical protein